jgi:hypothetical protein
MGDAMLRTGMLILWPSFIAAIVAEGFFFSLFDPLDLVPEISPKAAYTAGFFCFWTITALASALTAYLSSSAPDRLS